MTLEQDAREALCEIGRRVWQRGFVASNDGNFSFRLSEDRVLCTPTMVSKGFMKPEDMVIVDLEGNQVAGQRRATSEVRIHLFLYQQRSEVYSVVHVHPPHAVAFAATGEPLPKGILPEAEVVLGEVPLVPYTMQGTWEFARSIAPWACTHDAFLLANHGALTAGRDPYDAYYRMETLDQYCRVLLLAKQAGELKRIAPERMDQLMELKGKMGIRDWRPKSDLFSPEVLPTEGRGDLPEQRPFKPFEGPMTDAPKLGS